MSAQEFQFHLEDKYFNQGAAAMPEVVVTAPSFDEGTAPAKPYASTTEPEPKRKKSILTSAQEQGRAFQRKLSNQADNFKNKLSSMKKPKPTETISVTVVEDDVQVEEEVVIVESPESEEVPSKKRFQKPDFGKLKGHLPEFKRPEMTKFKKPNFEKIKAIKRPSFERPRMPDIPKVDFNKHLQSMRKLGRGKYGKEENKDGIEEETEPATIEVNSVEEEIPKKKRFDIDFRTYPRMLSNKLKKQRKVLSSGTKTLTPELKPRVKKNLRKNDSEETDSGKFAEYNKDIDLDRETSVERRMRVHLEKAIEEYRQLADEEQKVATESLQKKKKKGFKPIPQPSESFDSREFDFNQNEMESEGASKTSMQEIQDIITRSEKRRFNRTDTQSLQSEDRRGVLEEIDDDQFFLRKKGISEDNIQIGEYISSAIREGLMDPVNILAQMGDLSEYGLDEEELKYLQEIEKQGSEFGLELDERTTKLPTKPGRRTRKQTSEDRSSQLSEPIRDIDEESIELSNRDLTRFVPPTPPRRRKKRNATVPKQNTAKQMNGFDHPRASLPGQDEVIQLIFIHEI